MKSSRLEIRLSAHEKSIIEKAAKKAAFTVSGFVRWAAIIKATEGK